LKLALSGLRAWLVQRASAVYMLLFIVYLLGHFVLDRPDSYTIWRDWMLSPGVSISATIFFAALLLHAWVGLRDVALDYVQPVALRIGFLTLLVFALAAAGLWVVRILWLGHG
jgi:succinate dehydrogenase / fumarate reductase membrane anchor subunit